MSRWLKGDFKSINIKLERYNLIQQNKGNTYLKFLVNTYQILKKNYPNEYIIKNEFNSSDEVDLEEKRETRE